MERGRYQTHGNQKKKKDQKGTIDGGMKGQKMDTEL